MNHITHIRFIDPHSECDCCDHDTGTLIELILVAFSLPLIKPRVIDQGIDSTILQLLGHLFGLSSTQTIDNPRLSHVLTGNKVGDFIQVTLRLFYHAITDIGTVKACNKSFRIN